MIPTSDLTITSDLTACTVDCECFKLGLRAMAMPGIIMPSSPMPWSLTHIIAFASLRLMHTPTLVYNVAMNSAQLIYSVCRYDDAW